MKRALVIALLLAVAVPLLIAVADLPPHGSPDAPAHTHVAPRYLERGAEEAGAENIVTAVILNYRGLDTLGEVTVIFTAMAAVLAVLVGARAVTALDTPASALPVSMIVRFIVRVLAPFIVLFSIYVVLNGHVTPGGGFQGGTIAGALVIALTLIMSDEQAARLLPRRPERVLQAAAPLAFIMTGVTGLLLTGDFLGYPVGHESALVATLMLTFVEIGIGVGGAMVIATIFRTMGAGR
ncbi:MAG: sodium:proton antiporter [Aeromicrobium sp.]|jgi:multicomponent Na+:H+ antiporter subunit B|nr:sodium:proton antiporter [Aeromicrobium sp.]